MYSNRAIICGILAIETGLRKRISLGTGTAVGARNIKYRRVNRSLHKATIGALGDITSRRCIGCSRYSGYAAAGTMLRREYCIESMLCRVCCLRCVGYAGYAGYTRRVCVVCYICMVGIPGR